MPLPSWSRKANMGGTPSQRSTSSASTPLARIPACTASASAATNLMPVSTPAWHALVRRDQRDRGRRPARRHLDPAAAAAHVDVEALFEAERPYVEVNRPVLIRDRYADRAYVGDLAYGHGLSLLKQGLARADGGTPPGSSVFAEAVPHGAVAVTGQSPSCGSRFTGSARAVWRRPRSGPRPLRQAAGTARRSRRTCGSPSR